MEKAFRDYGTYRMCVAVTVARLTFKPSAGFVADEK
jgi:hypothetical protein